MKQLKFESNLEYQREAIVSITDIFKGQAVANGLFTVRSWEGLALLIKWSDKVVER